MRQFQTIFIIVTIALIILSGTFFLLSQPPPPEPIKIAASPTPTGEIILTLHNQTITQQNWDTAVRLDRVMSRLAQQPPPTAEETLDRLKNEIIILAEAEALPTPSPSQVEDRLQRLLAAWQLSEAELTAALTEAGVDRTALTDRISRLIQVETALNQAPNDQGQTAAAIDLAESTATPLPTPSPTPTRPAPPPEMKIAPYPDNAAPDFTLPGLDGEPLTLSQLRGQPVILNFWAGWCPPCRQELPALQAAYQAYDIGFVAVNVKEKANTVADFAERMALDFPIALDKDGAVGNGLYEVRGLPTTLFIDAQGVVMARHVGPLDEESIARYLGLPDDGATEQAPDFTLPDGSGGEVSLQDYRNKSNVALIFYRGHT